MLVKVLVYLGGRASSGQDAGATEGCIRERLVTTGQGEERRGPPTPSPTVRHLSSNGLSLEPKWLRLEPKNLHIQISDRKLHGFAQKN